MHAKSIYCSMHNASGKDYYQAMWRPLPDRVRTDGQMVRRTSIERSYVGLAHARPQLILDMYTLY